MLFLALLHVLPEIKADADPFFIIIFSEKYGCELRRVFLLISCTFFKASD